MLRVLKISRFRTSLALLAVIPLPLAAQRLSPLAEQQINDVLSIKRSLTPAQQKQSTDLIMAARKLRNQSLGSIPSSAVKKLDFTSNGTVAVDIRVDSLAAPIQKILAVGGKVVYSSPRAMEIRANIPLTKIDEVAAVADVHWIRSADKGHTNRIAPPTGIFGQPIIPSHSFDERRRAFLAEQMDAELPLLASNGRYPALGSLLNPFRINAFIGAVTSQGYVTHAAKPVVAMGINGTGVRVGVLSDSASAERVSALIASGDLPPDTVVVPGKSGTDFPDIPDYTDEGAAMMEIVHDLAPGAKLFFATAEETKAEFADNIRILRFTYHCDIIVDDVTYFSEGAFQDGIIAQAVNDVTKDGALYFSAAANSGNLTFGTSGTWEGDFKDGGDAGPFLDALEQQAVRVHNFASSGPAQNFNILIEPGLYVTLKWSDPLGASSNDYDLFAFDKTGANLVGFSAYSQTGKQDPYEIMGPDYDGYIPTAGDLIVVVRFSGAARALRLDTNEGFLNVATDGSTFGHNAAASTFTVAATYWNSAHTGTRPFVGKTNPIETFSSDGPRKIFYKPDGTPITPGNVLFNTNGGQTLQKPDATAADGVFTKSGGLFLPFFGTSAAAPHAAAIAALVKSANPFLTNAQIRSILTSTALDNMESGVDHDGGYGVLMALPAVQKALLTP